MWCSAGYVLVFAFASFISASLWHDLEGRSASVASPANIDESGHIVASELSDGRRKLQFFKEGALELYVVESSDSGGMYTSRNPAHATGAAVPFERLLIWHALQL